MSNKELLHLLDQFLAGKLSPEEQVLFDDWYAKHTAGPGALSEAGNDAGTAAFKSSLLQAILKKIHGRRKAKLFRLYAVRVAACVCVAAGIYLFVRNNDKQAGAENAVAGNAVGQTAVLQRVYNNGIKAKEYILADGSVVQLSAKSEMVYSSDFNKTGRTVLLKGKAHFKVAQNSSHLFTVFSGSISTTALGTVFSVNAFDSAKNIRVALYAGKVVIKHTTPGKGFADVYLKPGQSFNLNNTAGVVRVTQTADEETALPGIEENKAYFATGYEHVFEQTPLDSVLHALESGYHTVIRFRKKDIQDIHFSGVIVKSDSLSQVMKRIAVLHNVHFINTAGNEFMMQKNP
ncbi:FecR family protein [Deminuibacter soli]|uniref:FecR family protein n=1 Tax=Deminuibacter soli TaxID=2291815 RepID=A0A3E1NF90_9BACT|nr:FecR domain-containing protein [Deminuibacter soli]RFM26630.1 FecR family protein [Deminuibacter soli]